MSVTIPSVVAVVVEGSLKFFGSLFAGEEFLEEDRLFCHRRNRLIAHHDPELVAQREQARRLDPHDRRPALVGGTQGTHQAGPLFARLIHHTAPHYNPPPPKRPTPSPPHHRVSTP